MNKRKADVLECSRKPSKLRMQAMNWLVTFPNGAGMMTTSCLLDALLSFCERKGVHLRQALVATEACQEGDSHVHMVIKLTKKICTYDPCYFDSILGKPAKVQTCRKFNKTVVLVGKGGNFSTFNLDYPSFCLRVLKKKHVKHCRCCAEYSQPNPTQPTLPQLDFGLDF